MIPHQLGDRNSKPESVFVVDNDEDLTLFRYYDIFRFSKLVFQKISSRLESGRHWKTFYSCVCFNFWSILSKKA